MAQIYTPPTNNETAGLFPLFTYINKVAEGFFFTSISFVIWVIILVTTKDFGASKAFTFASFISFLLTLILSLIDLVSPKVMYLFLIMLAGGVVWIKLESQAV